MQYIDSHAARNANGPGYEVFLLMEYCSRNGLIDFMNERLRERLSEAEVLTIGSNIAEAVFCMHFLDQALLHRDLKIENVLISGDGKFKLCDFGSVSPVLRPPRNQMELRILDDDIQRHTTVQYRSPEMVDIYRGFPIDEKSDIWALGVFFYKLCYYITPFEQQGQMAILNAQFSFPAQPHYSDGLKHLISVLLREDPRNRPNIYQTIQELSRLRGVPVPDHITKMYFQRKEERRIALEAQVQGSPPLVPQNAAPLSTTLQTLETPPPEIVPMARGRVPPAAASAVSDSARGSQTNLAGLEPPPPNRRQLDVPESGHSRNHSQSSIEAFDPEEAAARYPTVEEITRSLESNNLWDAPPSRGVSAHASAHATRDNSTHEASRVAVPAMPVPVSQAPPQISPQAAPAILAHTAPMAIPYKAKSQSPPVQSYKSNNPYLGEQSGPESSAHNLHASSESMSSDDGGYYQPRVDRSYRDEFAATTPQINTHPLPVLPVAPAAPVVNTASSASPAAAMQPPRKPARPTSLYMRQNSSRASIISEHDTEVPQIQYSDFSSATNNNNSNSNINNKQAPGDHDELQAILTGLSEHETTVVLDDRTHHHIDSSVDFLQEHDKTGGHSWKLFRSLSSGSSHEPHSHHHSQRRKPSIHKMLNKHRHRRESEEYDDDDASSEEMPSVEMALNLNIPKRSSNAARNNNRWSKSFESLGQHHEEPSGSGGEVEPPHRASEDNRHSRRSLDQERHESRSRDGGRKSLDAQRFEKKQEELRAHARAAASEKPAAPTVPRKSLDLSRVESRVDDERKPREVAAKPKRFSRSGSIQGRIHALINRRPSPPRKTASGYGKYTESESDTSGGEGLGDMPPARVSTAPTRSAPPIRVNTDDSARTAPPRPSPKPAHLQSPKLTGPNESKPDLPPRKPTRVMTEDDDWKASFNEKYPSLG